MPAGLLVSSPQVGIREELADYIAIVDAQATPFTSAIPKGKELGNMRFDWQVDDYADPIAGGWVDGVDVVATALTVVACVAFLFGPVLIAAWWVSREGITPFTVAWIAIDPFSSGRPSGVSTWR